jgi:hypothetical protein
MLNEQQAVAIYTTKLVLLAQSLHDQAGVAGADKINDTRKTQVIKGRSARVAVMYGVTPRTIRDIWNRHSWAYATRHLWSLEPQISDENTISMPAVKVCCFICFYHFFFCTADWVRMLKF